MGIEKMTVENEDTLKRLLHEKRGVAKWVNI